MQQSTYPIAFSETAQLQPIATATESIDAETQPALISLLKQVIKHHAQADLRDRQHCTCDAYLDAVRQTWKALKQTGLLEIECEGCLESATLLQIETEAEQQWQIILQEIYTLETTHREQARQALETLILTIGN